jgi:hypothetical protein
VKPAINHKAVETPSKMKHWQGINKTSGPKDEIMLALELLDGHEIEMCHRFMGLGWVWS